MKNLCVILLILFFFFLEAASFSGEKQTSLKEKLETLLVKEISLDETSLEDTLKYLSKLSGEISPDGKKVNIYLIAPENVKNRKITMQLSDISLGEAVRYIATLSNLTMRVEKYAVVLKQKKKSKGRQ